MTPNQNSVGGEINTLRKMLRELKEIKELLTKQADVEIQFKKAKKLGKMIKKEQAKEQAKEKE